jgi:fibronectin-binding autotransporter adhesin
MPYIANPLEGIPLVNTFITDQSLLGATPATDDVLIIYDQSATALKQLTIAELQASVLASPAFTGVPTAPTAGGGTNTTQLATTAFVTTATTALNTITEMTDVTITSIGASEVLKWSGSAWINQTLAEANILPAAGPTFTGVLTVGSAVISEADLEQIDDLTAGTAVASKALVVDANKDIGTIRNLTIDGTFSDGNYTFDTSGNVSGLGTIGSGNITSTGTVQGTTITATTAFVPDASDGAALGTTALEFSDLFLADGAVISLGDDDDVTLTHVVDTGILLSSTDRFQFGDAGTFIHQSADGILTIESDTTVDINGAVVFGGALTGITTIASGTHTIGTLVLAAASITDSSGTINFGDENITTTGTTTTGNLTVTGTTTTVNTATLAVEDPLIILASGNAGGDTVDIGFYGLHDTTGSQDIYAGLFRDASDSGKWKLFGSLEVAPDTTVNVSGAGYAVGTLVANLEGNATGTAATVTTAAQPAITSVGTLSALAVTGAVVQGTLTTGSGSITDSSGAITFVNENLATTGTLAAGTTTIGSLVVAAASITDTSGAISFGNENLSTTGTLGAGTTTIGTLVVAAASITDTSGSISFGNENLSTSGTLGAGTTTIGTLVVAAASITDTSGSLSFGDENLSTTGTLGAGAITGTGLDINGAADISGVLTMSGGTLDMSGEDVDNIRSATFIAELANGNTGTSMTIDWGAAQKQSVVLNGDCAFTFTNPDGPCNLMLKVTHAANTTTYTPTWAGGSTNVDWPAAEAPEFTQTSGSVDIIAFYFDGAIYYGQSSLAFG